MGNLMLVINSFQSLIDNEELKGNSLLFITTNSVFVGKVVNLKKNETETDPNTFEDLIKHAYALSNEIGLEHEKTKDLDFRETILLKDAKMKFGKSLTNIPYAPLSLRHIISVQVVGDQYVDELLDSM